MSNTVITLRSHSLSASLSNMKFQPHKVLKGAFILACMMLWVLSAIATNNQTSLADIDLSRNDASVVSGSNNQDFRYADDLLGDMKHVVMNFRGDREQAIAAGSIRTKWFDAPEQFEIDLLVPTMDRGQLYFGSHHDTHNISFVAQCYGSMRDLSLYHMPQSYLTTVLIKIPEDFCAEKIRLVLTANVDGQSIALSRPRQTSKFERFLYSHWILISAVIAFMVSLLLLLPMELYIQGRLRALTAQFIGLGLYGIILYLYIFPLTELTSPAEIYSSRISFILTSLSLALASLIVLAPAKLWKNVSWEKYIVSGGVVLSVCLAMTLSNTGVNARAVALAAYPASWGVDFLLPLHFAQEVFVGNANSLDVTGMLGFFSQVDRGFMQSGWLVHLMSLLETFGLFEHSVIRNTSSGLFLVFIQSFFLLSIVDLFVFRNKIKIPSKLKLTALAFVVVTPLGYVGLYMNWPKYIAGTYVALSYLVYNYSCRVIKTGDMPKGLGLAFVTALLFSLGYASHSGAVFGGVGLAAIGLGHIWANNFRVSLKTLIFYGLSAILTIATLGIYEVSAGLVGEKSSYGMDFILNLGHRPDASVRDVLATTKEFYASKGFVGTIRFRFENVWKWLIWNPTHYTSLSTSGVNGIAAMRSYYFFSAVLSAWPVYLVLALRVFSERVYANSATNRSLLTISKNWKALWLGALTTAVIFIIISNAPLILHHIPYIVFIAILVLGARNFVLLPRQLRRVAIGVTLLLHIIIWVLPVFTF